jgi:hypothetical protein
MARLRTDPEELLERAASLDDIALALECLLSGGYSVWPDGTLLETRHLVERVHGLQIHVYSRDHAPPHFHVLGGDIDAAFLVESGDYLKGRIDRRSLSFVEWWYKRSRPIIVRAWNDSRPSDCPVGPISDTCVA